MTGYGAAGQQRSRTIIDGTTPMTTVLDPEGRATSLSESAGGTGPYQSSYGYDSNDLPITATAPGGSGVWIRTFFRDHLAAFPHAAMLLDWYHLAKKCRDLAARICPQQERRDALLRRLLRALWAGNVARAARVLAAWRREAADPEAVDTLCTYLDARAEWIPD